MNSWWTDRKKLKAAHLHYVEGWSHFEIAKYFGVSRPVLTKILTTAKEEGNICISYANTDEAIDLQNKIKSLFSLSFVRVVPSLVNSKLTKNNISTEAALYISTKSKDVKTLGIGWGNSIYNSLMKINYESFTDVNITPLAGGFGSNNNHIHANNLAIELAKRLNSKASFLYSPLLVNSLETKKRLLKNREINRVLSNAKDVEFAIVGIGSKLRTEAIYLDDYLEENDILYLNENNYTGDILSCYFDDMGKEISPPFYERKIGITLEDIRNIPEVLCIASDDEKATAIYTAIKYQLVNSLVITENIANSIINLKRKDNTE